MSPTQFMGAVCPPVPTVPALGAKDIPGARRATSVTVQTVLLSA
jgi:hypothetical protein